MSKKPTVLMILDGFGLNDKTEGNAVAQAKKPNIDALMREYPFVKGNASGLAVGLPDGQMGNSEVGHLNMGAGRIVYQELTRITKEINDGEFFSNQALLDGIANVKENNSDLHLYGLLSDGGVHSHITHLYGLLELAKRQGVKNVYVHCFLDGRDTAPTSGKGFIEALEAKMAELGIGKIASISGRYYAMDRDNRWDRVQKAYDVLTKGEGETAESAVAAMEASYAKDVTDEFFVPTAITENGKPVATIKDKDTVIFFNFRPDRAREITRTFCADEFDGFDRGARKNVKYICFTEYDVTIPNKEVAFKKVELKNTFGEYLAAHGMTQARIAETEKYAHVTFFFNGGVEEPNVGEDRILVKSPKVATYDLQPEMSAPEVCEKLCAAIRSEKYDVIGYQLCKSGYGWTYRYYSGSHQGNRDRRYLRWKGSGGIKGSRRTDVHLCRPRKCRADGGLRDRCTVYRTYDESGTVYSGQCRSVLHTQRERMSGRYYPDVNRTDGNGAAGRDDRKVTSDQEIKNRTRKAVPGEGLLFLC